MIIRKREPYDPAWLLEIAKRECPGDRPFHIALTDLTEVVGYCGCGCGDPYFVDPESSGWKHSRDVRLPGPGGLDIIVEIQESGNVGFIEIGHWQEKK